MADDSGIKVQSEVKDGAVIVSPEGDVDLSRSPVLRNSLKQALTAKPKRLVVDLGLVDYMDSSGVATLVEALQVQRKGGNKLVLCSLQPKVRGIFEIARLNMVFEIVADAETAKKA